MATFAEVRFKGTRRGYFTVDPLFAELLSPGDPVIVQADRGEDLGWLSALGAIAERKCSSSGGCATPAPELQILRRASAEEQARTQAFRQEEDEIRTRVRAVAREMGLRMKISETEWQLDRGRLLIYFTAERRVDFREMVRTLAREYRTRIELRQIGVRDEAALLGGVGRCGRELCCSTWLPELKSVSLQLAKDQNLSLNPAQISGCCGRLMCCLQYEHDMYVETRRRFPREGRIIQTDEGEEQVVSVDIWGETITLRNPEGVRRTVPLDQLKTEVRQRSQARMTQESDPRA